MRVMLGGCALWCGWSNMPRTSRRASIGEERGDRVAPVVRPRRRHQRLARRILLPEPPVLEAVQPVLRLDVEALLEHGVQQVGARVPRAVQHDRAVRNRRRRARYGLHIAARVARRARATDSLLMVLFRPHVDAWLFYELLLVGGEPNPRVAIGTFYPSICAPSVFCGSCCTGTPYGAASCLIAWRRRPRRVAGAARAVERAVRVEAAAVVEVVLGRHARGGRERVPLRARLLEARRGAPR